MRVCFVTTEYPPDVYWGGIATYVHAMANELARLGHEVHVVAHAREREGTENGAVHVHWLRGRRPRWLTPVRYLRVSSEWMVHFAREVKRELKLIRRQYGPLDVVEACETQAPAYFAAGLDPPLITHLANPGYSTRQYTPVEGTRFDFWLRDSMERSQTRRSAAVSSPSCIMAEKVARDWGLDLDRITIIPNPAPPAPASMDTRVADEVARQGPYIIFFGRLQSLKGVHILAQALPEVFRGFADLNMVWVGRDTPWLPTTMKAFILEKCAPWRGRMIFFEKLPREKLFPLVKGARLAVLPSLWESFGNVYLEAMSLGVPVIGSWNTGAQEIIEDGVSGFLARPGDVDSLQAAMVRTLTMSKAETNAMAANAMRRCGDFDIRRMAELRLRYYRTLAGV